MDHLVSAVLLAVSSNVDHLGVGIAYGMEGRNIRVGHNVMIALVSGAGTLSSMAAGEWVNDFMSEAFANVLGSAIMIAIGLYGVVYAARNGDRPSPWIGGGPATSTSEAAWLACSLAFNNLGTGLGAGISHVDIALTTALTTFISLGAIAGGRLLGRRTSRAIPQHRLGVTAGLIFVAVGVYELFV